MHRAPVTIADCRNKERQKGQEGLSLLATTETAAMEAVAKGSRPSSRTNGAGATPGMSPGLHP